MPSVPHGASSAEYSLASAVITRFNTYLPIVPEAGIYSGVLNSNLYSVNRRPGIDRQRSAFSPAADSRASRRGASGVCAGCVWNSWPSLAQRRR